MARFVKMVCSIFILCSINIDSFIFSIGKEKLCKLLLGTVILHKLENGNFYQIFGPILVCKDLDLAQISLKKHKRYTSRLDQPYKAFLFDVQGNSGQLAQLLNSLLSSKLASSQAQSKKAKNEFTNINRGHLYHKANVVDKSIIWT